MTTTTIEPQRPQAPVEARQRRLNHASRARSAVRIFAAARALTVTGLVIYCLMAMIGVAVAIDPSDAFVRFGQLMGGLLVAGAIVWFDDSTTESSVAAVVAIAAVWFAAVLGGYALLTNEGLVAAQINGDLFSRIGPFVQQYRSDFRVSEPVHANVLGGILAVLLTLGSGGLHWIWLRRWYAGYLTMLPFVVGIVLLLLTTSRGAWLGTVSGLLVGWYLWWRTKAGRQSPVRWATDVLVILILTSLALGLMTALFVPSFAGVLGRLSIGDTMLSRSAVWRDTLPLVRDYRFTGSGLTGTAELYSAYVYLLHVDLLTHAHNLYLQIALEQGLMGLIGFLAMWLGTVVGMIGVLRFGDRYRRALAAGVLASLVTLGVHGLVDAGSYVSKAAPVLFIPFGIGWAVIAATRRQVRGYVTYDARHASDPAWLLGPAALIFAIIVVFAWPGSRAAMLANLGAVSQSSTELSVYSWPKWPLQDDLRRRKAVDLTRAVRFYSRTLFHDPANRTANFRVGQIALSLGDLTAAEKHLSLAHTAIPQERAATQLLGEVYALTDRPEQAVELWRTLNLEAGQLDVRHWWWNHVGTQAQVQSFDEAVELLAVKRQE